MNTRRKETISILSNFRRFVLLLLYSFAFGGFLFYASVVVPIGSNVLGTTPQGFVTRLVTKVINASVGGTTLLLIWELIAGRHFRSRIANRWLGCLTIGIALCCLVLAILHAQLDALLEIDEFSVSEPKRFYGLHRIYLWTSTIQWLCSLPLLWILVNCGPNKNPLPNP